MAVKSKLVVLSGAGLSADSGIQTFRGLDGLWMNHRIDEVANGLTWKKNWDVVRRFYNSRRTELATVEPNAMHKLIAEFQQRYPTVILTQNIDDLLERAGCTDVVHLHGKLTEMRCEACGHTWDIGYTAMEANDRCASHKCDSLKGVRPNVVFFNESAPNYRQMYKTFNEINQGDVVLVVGTSGVVLDINSLIFDRHGVKILNNLEPSEEINERYFHHVIYKNAVSAVAEIQQLVEQVLG